MQPEIKTCGHIYVSDRGSTCWEVSHIYLNTHTAYNAIKHTCACMLHKI